MRSNGLATILLLIPVLAVPALAIFGIPQFAPIVSSPLDEGHDLDRESRVGNSDRPAQEELFGDFEGFPSETQAKSDVHSEGRSSVLGTKNKPKIAPKRTRDSGSANWGQDWDSDSGWPENAPRELSSLDRVGSQIEDSPIEKRVPDSSVTADPVVPRQPSKPMRKRDESFRPASATDADLSNPPLDVAEVIDSPKSGSKKRDSRNAKHRDSTGASTESLTWQTAVARLHELDIRDFRIEPSYQSGQFVFTCWYTPPNASRVSYRFEAEAEEPLKAIEKALEQIVERQQKK